LDVPPGKWSLQGYRDISDALYRSFVVSLVLALVSTTASLILAVPAAFWLARSRMRGAKVVEAGLRSPLQLPQLVLGIGLFQAYVLYQQHFHISLRSTFTGLVIAHFVIVTPYVLVTCVSRIEALGAGYEDAARTLGAGPIRIACEVSLPLIRQALIASALLAMLISFDNVPLSLFLAASTRRRP
jgi:putative spermidine/putrescine transport system permease protein